MSSELMEAAEAVCTAVRRHAAAVADAADERAEAGAALVSALATYGAAVVNAGFEAPEELEDFDAWLDEEDGVHHPEPEPEVGDRVALFVRADFVVEDLDALRAAAIELMQACCPVPADEDPSAAVRDPSAAVLHLFGHLESVVDHEQMQARGLNLVREHVTTASVEPPDDEVAEDPWAPLWQLLDEDHEQPPDA